MSASSLSPKARLLRSGAAGLLLATLAAGPQAQDLVALKAAIVVNLLQFAQWPGEEQAPTDAPIRLCADAGGTLWPQLGSLQGRPVRGAHPLQLRDVPAAADGLRQCHAWVLEAPPARRLTAAAAEGLPVLVIGDVGRGDEPGVVVALHHSGGRLAFEVDLRAARRNGLQLSSKLLRLAGKLRE